ncbi:uncharacterized protein CIMG_13668 [Coccidioides immitis RS]|uniref:Uncharacterized protein n=1 Tax=Coccidioides immitis (strain RS) TaxID=246410 RepID=A0A0D8JVS9_COCIM|nr:uncharacterized protein CIMG_13668 [Coccidioides immitis RS]KJF61435.1 hypothetical protein CIMG_13668 [Coccidioides immitis RS]
MVSINSTRPASLLDLLGFSTHSFDFQPRTIIAYKVSCTGKNEDVANSTWIPMWDIQVVTQQEKQKNMEIEKSNSSLSVNNWAIYVLVKVEESILWCILATIGSVFCQMRDQWGMLRWGKDKADGEDGKNG